MDPLNRWKKLIFNLWSIWPERCFNINKTFPLFGRADKKMRQQASLFRMRSEIEAKIEIIRKTRHVDARKKLLYVIKLEIRDKNQTTICLLVSFKHHWFKINKQSYKIKCQSHTWWGLLFISNDFSVSLFSVCSLSSLWRAKVMRRFEAIARWMTK